MRLTGGGGEREDLCEVNLLPYSIPLTIQSFDIFHVGSLSRFTLFLPLSSSPFHYHFTSGTDYEKTLRCQLRKDENFILRCYS